MALLAMHLIYHAIDKFYEMHGLQVANLKVLLPVSASWHIKMN